MWHYKKKQDLERCGTSHASSARFGVMNILLFISEINSNPSRGWARHEVTTKGREKNTKVSLFFGGLFVIFCVAGASRVGGYLWGHNLPATSQVILLLPTPPISTLVSPQITIRDPSVCFLKASFPSTINKSDNPGLPPPPLTTTTTTFTHPITLSSV